MNFYRLILGSGVLMLVHTPLVSAQTLEVATRTLKNGLKILVHEDHSIPNVALYFFYRIGSRNERPGTTGVSHFFEHMMFNGARKYGPKQFDVVMEAAGGSNNAYTNQDVTVYQDWFPRSALKLIFDLEADRIQYLSFDPKMIESERGVVASERRVSVENDNAGLLEEQLWATAFTAHPYQWPVVGWMIDIENWSVEDLKNHFRMGYAPRNGTLVAVGDVTVAEIDRLAREKLESIPSRDVPPRITTREPEQLGERRVTIHKFAQLPLLTLAYHVPESAHPDYYPLKLLETVLLTGQSSRLYHRVVDEEQLALSISGGLELNLDPTLFVIRSQPRENVDPKVLEKAIMDEVRALQSRPVSERELTKARNLLLARFYRAMKTIDGKADELGRYEVYFGDYRKLFQVEASYNRVGAEDVRRAALSYFSPRNVTVATLIPETEPIASSEAGPQK
ncbi:MAG: pitrilysin family protein [Acidobacteriota bacterium]